MIPIVPILLVGGGIWAAAKLARRWRDRSDPPPAEPIVPAAPPAEPPDDAYQAFFRDRIDPLFGTTERDRQFEEFTSHYSLAEADINRRLGLAAANSGLAVLGAMALPPLSLLSAGGLVAIMWPLARRNFRILFQEKRLKYRLVATLSIWAGLLAGYYVVSSLMAVTVFTAFKIAARTEARSRGALMDAFALQPPTSVWVRHGEVELEIPFADLRIGDVLVLTAGQTAPIDGVVVAGMATLDQHLLTGESRPVEKAEGDRILANTLVLTGRVAVRVEQTGADTAAGQIGRILTRVGAHRLEHEARSERLADRLTVPVLGASGLALLTVGPSGAAAILNSGFGSILFFAGPLTMLSHLNRASHHGILVKDGRSFEALAGVDTVVFDKTGTLTLEEPEVAAIHPADGFGEAEVLAFAAAAEHRQSHPVARAILTEAARRGIEAAAPDATAYEVGFGVQVDCGGRRVQVGSRRFMVAASVALPADFDAVETRCREDGSAPVFVAVDGRAAGVIELRAKLRPGAAALVERLRRRGQTLCILSGDHAEPTRHLAERLGIERVFAEVLPEGKAEIIERLQAEGRRVCFIGDGINDAIALRRADVSVSLRGASTVATDGAQIILLGGSLTGLDQLFELGDDFARDLDRSLTLAFVPGAVLIAGVFTLGLGMPSALVIYTAGLTAALYNALAPMRRPTLDAPAAEPAPAT